MRLVPIGGRIKSASVGLNHLYATNDVVRLNVELKKLRKKPMTELLEAFFPSDITRLKQMMRGVGFYRPVLKTDQGMAGNFLPFYINPNHPNTDLSVRRICKEEGLAIPEAYCLLNQEIVESVQREFNAFNLRKVDEILQRIGSTRKADKGRAPFFLIRPALLNKEIVFGQDLIKRVNDSVSVLLQDVIERANEEEKKYSGCYQADNLLYCQADVFILSDGTVTVEQINCPDVGMFLNEIHNPFSKILPLVQKIVGSLQEVVCKVLVDNINSKQIAIVTRNQVLENQEDILELMEMESLKKGLSRHGVELNIYSISQVNRIPIGQKVILLNVDYRDGQSKIIFDRHCSKELTFYPNPFFQRICQNITGLQEVTVPSKYHYQFLDIIRSIPKNDDAVFKIWHRLEKLLCGYGVNSDIINADIGFEIVPIFRRSLHSWRVLNTRIGRYNGTAQIKLRLIPACPQNLILTSDSGPRLHVFRFMFVK